MADNESNGRPINLVIFGASGDLTRRKLVPALYNVYRKGRLPHGTRITGFARRSWSDEEFRTRLREGVERVKAGLTYSAREVELPLTDLGQHVLHAVGEVVDSPEPQHPGEALYGMNRAEGVVDQLGRSAATLVFEFEQVAVQGDDMLPRLLNKIAQ